LEVWGEAVGAQAGAAKTAAAVVVVVEVAVAMRTGVIAVGAKHHLQKPDCAVHKERVKAGSGMMDVVETETAHTDIVGSGMDSLAAADKENIDAGTKVMI
jgi:hypothetical protein